MKILSIAAILAVALVLALVPAASMIYGEAYPGDAAKRAALAACAAADPGFNRLIAGERAACYARLLSPPPEAPQFPRHEDIADNGAEPAA